MIEGSYTLGKLGSIASKLIDILDYIQDKVVLLPVNHLPEILEAVVNSNKKLLHTYYTLGCFGVRKQLDEVITKDLASQMKDLMQWSKEEIRNHVRMMKLLDLGQFHLQQKNPVEAMKCIDEVLEIEPTNRIALIAKASIFKHLGNLDQAKNYKQKYEHIKTHPLKKSITHHPQEEFEQMLHKIVVGEDKIAVFNDREFYSHCDYDSEPQGLLEIVMEAISFIGALFIYNKKGTPMIDDLDDILKDLIFFFSEWLPFLSGAVYYILEHGFGSREQVALVLSALKQLIQDDIFRNMGDLDEKLLVDYEKQITIDKIQALESKSMNNTRIRQENYRDLRDIEIGYIDGKRMHFYHVVDFEREELKRKMFNPFEKVIKDKKITIMFAYPLSNLLKLNIENGKGFSRMDLFKAIYHGYKKIYNEEEAGVGDPGTWKYAMNRATSNGKYGIWNHYIEDLVIERVSYSPSKKTVELFIGS